MDPVVLQPPWIPQDDLLLKNAIEGGASLESLAKGAVRFSRRYSLAELRERWRSMLYDPDVSAQASASMVELELANSAGGSGTKEGGGKRKPQSLRMQYRTMRKRFCKQVFDSLDMALRDEMSLEKHGVGCDGYDIGLFDGGLNKDLNNLLVNNLGGFGNFSGVEGIKVGSSDSMSGDVPLWKTIEDVSVPVMPVQVSEGNKSNRSQGRGKCITRMLNHPDAMLRDDDTHISLLDLSSDDELLFMDIDGEAAGDKPCYDNVDSLLVNSPCDIQGNDASDVHDSQKLSTETEPGMPGGSPAVGLEAVASNPPGSSRGDPHLIPDPGNDFQSPTAGQSPQSELSVELTVCILNTEDPCVPCNDGSSTAESIEAPDSVTLKSQPIVKEVGCSDTSIISQRKNEQDGNLKKVDTVSQSLAASQTGHLGPVLNTSSTHPLVVPKTENPGRNSLSAVPRPSKSVIVNVDPSRSRSVHATMTPALDGNLIQQEFDSMASAEVNAHSREEELMALPKSQEKSSSPNQEGGDDDDDDDNYTDNEIPYFSDAETMILEMDLSPTDQDTSANREVLRYQHDETKRTIMRLEQCAQSFLKRDIASHGALAIFYGRTLKQYIKKSEVILGRATDEVQVDIDLGREGHANKISRRQASIKLDANGSFVIKNLGKSSIFLNGKEVATGQLRGLSASSLIEIRGMSFIFEVNNKCVKKFLENVNGKGETVKENM